MACYIYIISNHLSEYNLFVYSLVLLSLPASRHTFFPCQMTTMSNNSADPREKPQTPSNIILLLYTSFLEYKRYHTDQETKEVLMKMYFKVLKTYIALPHNIFILYDRCRDIILSPMLSRSRKINTFKLQTLFHQHRSKNLMQRKHRNQFIGKYKCSLMSRKDNHRSLLSLYNINHTAFIVFFQLQRFSSEVLRSSNQRSTFVKLLRRVLRHVNQQLAWCKQSTIMFFHFLQMRHYLGSPNVVNIPERPSKMWWKSSTKN